MVNVNILYDTASGRIHNANLGAITPIPVGFAVLVKDVASIANLFDKKIRIPDLALVDKDFLKYEGDPEITAGVVVTSSFTKRNGETEELLGGATDNEEILFSLREPDLSFDASIVKSFLESQKTSLVQGAGQVKLAASLAPGGQALVLFNDRLKPLFQQLTYV